MDYRSLPKTDLKVSILGFGNFTFGTNWWIDITNEDAIRLQNEAFDRGVNFFDTAPAYGNGRAEWLMPGTIAHAGRDNLVISTKFGYDFYSDPGEKGVHRERRQDFSPEFIRKDLEMSLSRMKTDYIDLYQAHNIKQPDFRDDVFETMEKLVTEGKIRSWGIALGPAIGWREEGYESYLQRGASIVQTVYNLYEQDPGREFSQIAQETGGGVIARVPTNSGILDEEFASENHQFPPNDHRKFRDHNWLIYGLKKNARVKPMAQELGLSLRQFAFKWLASQPAMVSIEPNILTLKDIEDFTGACDGKALPSEMLAQLSEWYDNDFGLGDEAHPCDWKSSATESGTIRSGYRKPDLSAGRS